MGSMISKKGVELFRVSQRERLFWSLIRTNCSLRPHDAPSFSPNPPSEKPPSSPLQIGQVENSHGKSFERRAY